MTGSLAALATAFYYSWRLTLVILASFPVAAIILTWISYKLTSAIEAQKRELSQAAKHLHTAVDEIEIVKVYNGQNEELWKYRRAVRRAAIHYLLQARTNALQFGFMKLIMVGVFIQGFWYGLVLVRQGMTTGHVLTTFYACLNALQAVEILLPQWLVLSKGMSASNTLQQLILKMSRDKKADLQTSFVKPQRCEGDIEISDVSHVFLSSRQCLLQ